jgi:hypothetical protein
MLIPSVSVPVGQKGDWKIERKYVEPKPWNNHGNFRHVPNGEYTFLYRGNTLVMSDTPDEKNDHLSAVINAKGNCLIAGLGIGMVLNAIAAKHEVTHIDVVEISEDVIELVSEYYNGLYGDKITFHKSSIFDFKPSIKYDMAWFDIWDNLCEDNLEEMAKLHRKFGKHAQWKGSWGREYLKYERQRNKNRYWR